METQRLRLEGIREAVVTAIGGEAEQEVFCAYVTAYRPSVPAGLKAAMAAVLSVYY
ncbi:MULTISPECIES: hypothetical protein [Paenibacillus]|uniref:hypothetical protein n=1 Tax=Paenibacillus TaxID=44249 RepID=UPI0022B90AA4|nr:hypothetical protein [Paenibacillus caseinilyticus]MCZ8523048.1 hypothetical protein [Paenibacillus caseinilyticus]